MVHIASMVNEPFGFIHASHQMQRNTRKRPSGTRGAERGEDRPLALDARAGAT